MVIVSKISLVATSFTIYKIIYVQVKKDISFQEPSLPIIITVPSITETAANKRSQRKCKCVSQQNCLKITLDIS